MYLSKTLLLVYLCIGYSLSRNIDNVVIKLADRVIDITTQLVKISTTITVENIGQTSFSEVVWGQDQGNTGKLSFIAAKDRDQELQVEETTIDNQPEKFYKISLSKPVNKGATKILTIEEVYTGGLLPFPTSIKQKEQQLIRYFGNQYLYSPYLVKKQSMKIYVLSKNIENYSKFKPYNQADGLLTYGPYENISPFTVSKLTVHYENNSPFLTVTNLKRQIEVSHWGNIAIEESVDLLHTGAALKGSFSRYEYQQDGNSGKNSIKSFKTLLPASAEKLYYRDFNGNISTSNMKVKKDSVEVDLRPRFPLFGGWKTCYTIGYNVPSYQYLFHSADQYVLKIRLLDHVFDDMQVDHLETEIMLPVGVTNIKLIPPYPIERLEDTVSFKYLDMKGRPVIRFTKTNLVENHIQDFVLQYNWNHVLMIHEPILLILALYILFLCVIIYVRFDFSIEKAKHLKKD